MLWEKTKRCRIPQTSHHFLHNSHGKAKGPGVPRNPALGIPEDLKYIAKKTLKNKNIYIFNQLLYFPKIPNLQIQRLFKKEKNRIYKINWY